ncbi:MAG TPA: hypothetical protein VJP59_04305 [Gemmatimonadota bacterium]|nr:hypothetical protein [Gemmatimonadota bacterium]
MCRRLAVCLTVAIGLSHACRQSSRETAIGTEDVPADSVLAGPPAETGSSPSGRDASFNYGCDREFRFVARVDPGGGSVRLVLPDTTISLPRMVSGSDTTFSDGTFTYRAKGDEASIETPGASFTGCVSDEGGPGWRDAAGRGVDFRAVGQEPGWVLDIHDGDSIALTTDYGQAHFVFPPVRPEVYTGAGRTVYRIETEAHRATIVVLDEPCRDSMSGWPYETTVSMILDDREFDGCGRQL